MGAIFRVSERFACGLVTQHRSTQRLAIKVVDIEEAKLRRRLRKVAAPSTFAGDGAWRIYYCDGRPGL